MSHLLRLLSPQSPQVGHTQNPVTIGVDAQDMTLLADAAVASLLESGILDRAPHQPAAPVPRFVNNTSRQLDFTLLPSQISATLLKASNVVAAEKGHDALDKASVSDSAIPSRFLFVR